MLNGCCIKGNSILSCDGFTLAKIDLSIDNQYSKDIIIPSASITELEKILDKKNNNKLVFNCENKRLSITGEGFTYITRLIDQEYLKVDNIIPSGYSFDVEVDKKAFSESVMFAKEVCASASKPVVKFRITDEFEVQASSLDKQFKEEIIADINKRDTKELVIGFDPGYIVNILKQITDDKIKMNYVGKNVEPMVITGNETKNEMYLILPVRLAEQ